ncbi:DUF4192 domain-containing protein [Rhodococcus sp. Z13]|uniref:DUF4192 domain-containing protein n=1 Tax=Rhodococcus sacchari TaxID=2962047 RepID=A0ACD4DKP9_9NOCA|nr:DUF4192 domain-containing protein [Rhodococcus sp. Z13]UYP20633.1 DUF4192 domain-containing protein [Rhodococcus sp. Z13]
MTTSTPSSSHPSSPPLRLADVGELIAALPALMGFPPVRSIVVMCLTPSGIAPSRPTARTASIGAVMRHDLLIPGPGEPVPDRMDEAFRRFRAVCAREGAESVAAVLVDDRLTDPGADGIADLCRLVDVFADRLDVVGIDLAGVYAVPEIAAGATWFVPGRDVSGRVADPAASVVAAARVYEGSPIRGSRDELAALLAPYPSAVRQEVARCIDEVVDSRDREYERVARSGGGERADRLELETVLAHIRAHAAGTSLSPSDHAELAVLLANRTVRDAVMGLANGALARDAERLWIELARVLPDPERADAAALVGFGAYVRGDGPLAGVAFAAALGSDPRHRLSDLLDQALQAGLRPDAIRGLAETGHEIASRLGVTLPPPEGGDRTSGH